MTRIVFVGVEKFFQRFNLFCLEPPLWPNLVERRSKYGKALHLIKEKVEGRTCIYLCGVLAWHGTGHVLTMHG